MQTALLILNTGSSSLKFAIYDLHLKELVREKIEDVPIHSIERLNTWLETHKKNFHIVAAGHRVVHGGNNYTSPTVINDSILHDLKKFNSLAPLHQPFNLEGVEQLKKIFPDLFQVACFDTTFHATQQELETLYALPPNISHIPIKRYGFHGLSYEYIATKILDDMSKKIMVAHLGAGVSMCAMQDKKSVATTMGFTALEGIPMGTRCGTIDPGIILYLLEQEMSLNEITTLLYQKSGLLGISEISSDIRELLNSKELSAKKAIDFFIHRIKREIGSLVSILNGLDTLIFTAGIGEHSTEIRSRICHQLEWLNVEIDETANEKNQFKISAQKSSIAVYVIPTNEELMIAKHTLQLFTDARSRLR